MTQGEGCGVVPICNISLAAGQSGVERGRVEAKRSVMKATGSILHEKGGGMEWQYWRWRAVHGLERYGDRI